MRNRSLPGILVYNEDDYTPTKKDYEEYVNVMEMKGEVKTFLHTFADDLGDRLGIGENKLPTVYGVSALLNPMFGRKKLIVNAGLMTDEQYTNAERELLSSLQDLYEASSVRVIHESSSDDDDSRDGLDTPATAIEYQQAVAELRAFEDYKKVRYHPTFCEKGTFKAVGPADYTIAVASKIEKRGKDLPSGKNLADYIDGKGRFDVMRFFVDHEYIFSKLFVIVQRMASRRVAEVGCERFFSISGYVSAPRRTRLCVRTYERLAMLSSIL